VPFQQYAPFFKPEELDALTAAFNATLQELRASGIDLRSEDKVALVKRKLAQRILVSATAGGVRDVETLKEQALRSLSGGVRPGGEQTFASEAA
jgi:ABC-type amino acid transport substrate-binding protein